MSKSDDTVLNAYGIMPDKVVQYSWRILELCPEETYCILVSIIHSIQRERYEYWKKYINGLKNK